MAFHFATILCVLLVIVSSSHGHVVWIDTDPSIGLTFREVDDAFALLFAFRSPEIKIAGISTTYGNASLRATTRIVQDLVARFSQQTGRENNFAICAGARAPSDLGQRTDATEGLANALRNERLTYLALGPLTNLASFLRLYPALAARIDRIVIVGGQTCEGRPRLGPKRWLRIHDANVFKDPAAMSEILQTTCPLILAPIETSEELIVTAADFQRMKQSSAGEFLYRRSRFWLWFWRVIVRMKGGPIFDALAVLAIVRPELIQSEERHAEMDDHGYLRVRERPTDRTRPVKFFTAIAPNANRFVADRLGAR